MQCAQVCRFTNMAQAFALAEVMYTGAGRKGVQSAILVLTDGKPSFKFQTNELVQQLDDKNVQRFFMMINEAQGDEMKVMQKWASQAWRLCVLMQACGLRKRPLCSAQWRCRPASLKVRSSWQGTCWSRREDIVVSVASCCQLR